MSDPKPLTVSSLTIATVASVKTRFLDALGASASVTIAAEAIESIDLAGIQLLVSLFRQSRVVGKKAALQGPLRESVREKILLIGMCEGLCETGEQLSEACAAC